MRSLFQISATIIGLSGFSAFLPGQSALQQWAVDDVWSPAPHHPDDRWSWYFVHPAGDVDRDGKTDLVANGTSTPDIFSGRSVWDMLRYCSGVTLTGSWDRYFPKPLSTIHLQNTKLKLRTPAGEIILLDDAAIPMAQAYDASTGGWIASIPQPPSPGPGIPPTQGMDWLIPAGDVNQDGYDDAFYHTYYQPFGYCGLIDGATLTVVWQRYGKQVDSVVLFYNGLAAPQPDLNQDGISDLAFGMSLWNGQQFGFRVIAVSGSDGSTLWDRSDSAVAPIFRQACGRDLDGDGTGDLVSAINSLNGPYLQAWSGRDGTTLWTFSATTLDPFLPAGFYGRNYRSPLMTLGVGAGGEEVVFHANYSYTSGSDVNRLIHLDGSTGALLDVVQLPPDIQPWSADLIEGALSTLYVDPAGDCDRDGFQEYAVRIPDPSHWPPWSSTPSSQCVFIGQQNLLLPSNARIGSVVQANLSVPSAAGFDFLLLASTTFDPAGGLSVQGWNTHLRAQDSLLQQTWNSRALNGRLGPQGNGSIAVRIPNQPNLIGHRLYFRALVRNPVTGEVWTRSSLAQLDVLP